MWTFLEINNFCVDKLQGPVFLNHSNNVPVDLIIRENYANKCFYHDTKASLPPHILRLKVGMPVMILCNLEPSFKCNGTRARITGISQHTIEAEVIGDSRVDTQIVISCIPLQSKDNKSSVSYRVVVPC